MTTNLKKQYFGDDFEGPSDDKIDKLIMLIKRFNSGCFFKAYESSLKFYFFTFS